MSSCTTHLFNMSYKKQHKFSWGERGGEVTKFLPVKQSFLRFFLFLGTHFREKRSMTHNTVSVYSIMYNACNNTADIKD
jgi:hypothetical protein